MANAMTEYRTYTDGDKAALKDLIAYAKTKTGLADIKTGDMICAVTPGLETPVELRGI
jgi:hypothetical protein